MKKIILIVVVLLVLGGGGFAVWKFMLGGGEKAAMSQAQELQAAPPVYVDLDPFVISVIRGNRVVKYLSLSLKLEVAGPVAEAKVKKMMPYLRDAYLTRLHTALSRGDPDVTYDAEKMKRILLAESEKVVGPGYVRDVLVGTIVEKQNPL